MKANSKTTWTVFQAKSCLFTELITVYSKGSQTDNPFLVVSGSQRFRIHLRFQAPAVITAFDCYQIINCILPVSSISSWRTLVLGCFVWCFGLAFPFVFPMELKLTKSNLAASVCQDKRSQFIKSPVLSYQNLVWHTTDTVRLALKYWMIFLIYRHVFNKFFNLFKYVRITIK